MSQCRSLVKPPWVPAPTREGGEEYLPAYVRSAASTRIKQIAFRLALVYAQKNLSGQCRILLQIKVAQGANPAKRQFRGGKVNELIARCACGAWCGRRFRPQPPAPRPSTRLNRSVGSFLDFDLKQSNRGALVSFKRCRTGVGTSLACAKPMPTDHHFVRRAPSGPLRRLTSSTLVRPAGLGLSEASPDRCAVDDLRGNLRVAGRWWLERPACVDPQARRFSAGKASALALPRAMICTWLQIPRAILPP